MKSTSSLQDNPATPAEPTESMTFTLYGLTGYSVQYWNGSAWTTVTGGTVTGNNKVWKKFTFTAITTTKIRVLTSSSPLSLSTSLTFTCTENSYISQSQRTSLPGSSLSLPFVNQNRDVIDGSMNASNTVLTGLRINIPLFATGAVSSFIQPP